jgi:hypothetical protein
MLEVSDKLYNTQQDNDQLILDDEEIKMVADLFINSLD